MAEKIPEKKTPTAETKLTETKLAETKPTAVAEVPKISAAKSPDPSRSSPLGHSLSISRWVWAACPVAVWWKSTVQNPPEKPL